MARGGGSGSGGAREVAREEVAGIGTATLKLGVRPTILQGEEERGGGGRDGLTHDEEEDRVGTTACSPQLEMIAVVGAAQTRDGVEARLA
jgi:hypothetical protein